MVAALIGIGNFRKRRVFGVVLISNFPAEEYLIEY